MRTEIKSINGMVVTEKTMRPAKVIVRFTSEHVGETLSLSDDDKIMISVPFELVKPIIEKARKK